MTRLASALAVLALATPALAAARRPAPACLPAAFKVVARWNPVLPDGAGDAIVVAPHAVNLGGSCGVARARVGRTRRFTTIAATWLSCERLVGKVRLKARIDARTCRSLLARIDAPGTRVHTTFTALRWQGAVTGTIVPPAGAVADTDTADPDAQDDDGGSATAVALAPGGTAGGAAWAVDDADFDDDWYALALDGTPRTITLTIADPTRADLDLFLVDGDAHDLVAPSRTDGAVEQLSTGDAAGAAFVVVSANPGSAAAPKPPARPWSAYVLAVDGPAPSAAGDVGPVWAILLDADSGAVVDRTRTSAAAGWALAFAAPVLPGRYRLVAGTDRDGDGVLGGAGEAFGWWPDGGDAGAVLEVAPDETVAVTLPVTERPAGATSPVAR